MANLTRKLSNFGRLWTITSILLAIVLAAIACVSINRAFPFAFPPIWGHMHDSRHRPAQHENAVVRPSGRENEPPSSFAHVTPRPRPTTRRPTVSTPPPRRPPQMSEKTPGTRKPTSTSSTTVTAGKTTATTATTGTSRTSRTNVTRTSTTKVSSLLPELRYATNVDESVQSRYKSRVVSLDFNLDKNSFAPRPVTPDAEVTVTTQSGPVKGVRGRAVGKQVHVFLGIPYAEPPVHGYRFRRSAHVKPWTEPLVADQWTPHCVQTFEADTILARTLSTLHMSEDCLYLNIWTPSIEMENDLKPVLIWIYGGGFKGGTAGIDEVDGRILSSHGDIVVVTFNYRTGALGFLDPDATDSPGNLGIYDCVLAIEWIKENARSFGGDPDQITLAGHYSGAVTVGMFMLMDRVKPLFRRAILQSGSPLFQETMSHDGKRDGVATSQMFLENIGCLEQNVTNGKSKNVLSCLKEKTIEEIIGAQHPLVATDDHHFDINQCDTELSPTSFFEAIKSSKASDFFSGIEDIMFGTNQDELSLSLVLTFPEMFSPQKIKVNISTLKELRELIIRMFNLRNGLEEKQSVRFMADYFFSEGDERGNTANLVQKMYRAFGDAAVGCPVNILAEEFSRLGKKVFVYEFAQRSKTSPWGQWMGVPFGSEQPFVFGHPMRHPQRYSRDDVDVSKRMVRMWSQFATSGTVSPQIGRSWKAYDNVTQEYVQINAKEANFGSRATNEVCNLFRFTLVESNSSSILNCPNQDEVTDLGFESTTTGDETTTVVTELPLLNLTGITICELYTFTSSTDEPTVEYRDFLVSGGETVATSNTTAYFTCEDHEILIGANYTECTENGNWTDLKPYCKSKELIKREEIERKRIEDAMTKYVLLRHIVVCELFEVNSKSLTDPAVTYEKFVSFKNSTKIFAVKGTLVYFSCPEFINETSPANLTGTGSALCGDYGLWDPPWKPKCERELISASDTTKIDDNDPAIEDISRYKVPSGLINQIVTFSLLGILMFVGLAAAYSSFGLYRGRKKDTDSNGSKESGKCSKTSSKSSSSTPSNGSKKSGKKSVASIALSQNDEEVTIAMSDLTEQEVDVTSDEDDNEDDNEEKQLLSSTEDIKKPPSDSDSSRSDGDNSEVQEILSYSPEPPQGHAIMKLAMANSLDSNMNEIIS